MERILESLNQELGVKGSLVMSPDGVIVMSVLGDQLDDDTVAAIMSLLLLTLNRSASAI